MVFNGEVLLCLLLGNTSELSLNMEVLNRILVASLKVL